VKLSEAKKIAGVIETAEDQHGSERATLKIRDELCAEMNKAFPVFVFEHDHNGSVGVRKANGSRDSVGNSLPNN
jgi:hypothetical protein